MSGSCPIIFFLHLWPFFLFLQKFNLINLELNFKHEIIILILKKNILLTLPCSPVPSSKKEASWNGQCVVDSASRVLPYFGGKSIVITPENCMIICEHMNYKLAGVQVGSECWCGNTAPKSRTSGVGCDFHCDGDRTKNCGGHWRMNVYSSS